jgi:hypothetical protein
VHEFRDLLESLGANATVRQNRGTEIDAACGQLAAGQPVTLSTKRGTSARTEAAPATNDETTGDPTTSDRTASDATTSDAITGDPTTSDAMASDRTIGN